MANQKSYLIVLYIFYIQAYDKPINHKNALNDWPQQSASTHVTSHNEDN